MNEPALTESLWASKGTGPSTTSHVDPTNDPQWEVLASGPRSSVFVSPLWLRTLTDGFGLEIRANVCIDQSGEYRSGLAFSHIDDERGSRTSCLPFSDYSDALGNIEQDWSILTDGVISDTVPFSTRTLIGSGFQTDSRLSETSRAGWHSQTLTGGEEDLWERVASSARQCVRRSRKSGIQVQSESDEASVHRFHDLHVGLRRHKYHMLAQPIDFFDAMLSNFGPSDSFRIIEAKDDSGTVAAVVLLRWGSTAYYKFNASHQRGLQTRANDAVMWGALQQAIEWGCDSFDFGLSDLDQPGLLRYKDKWSDNSSELVTFRNQAELDPRSTETLGTVNQIIEQMVNSDLEDQALAGTGRLLYRLFA